MRKILQIISVLTIVGIFSGACLVFTYKYASPLIAANQKRETEGAIFKVFPEADSYETIKVPDMAVFLVKDKSGKQLGYAFTPEGNGYQGTIKLMAGIKNDLSTMTGIEILESQETPGLGQEITTNNFKKQFNGLKTTPDITYIKGKSPETPNEIEAITGATISSRSVVKILNEGIAKLKKEIKH